MTRGRVVECDPPRHLVLTWSDDGWPVETVVEFSIEPLNDDRCRLRVRHHGWEGLPGLDRLIPAHRVGWLHHLRSWAAACAAAVDRHRGVRDAGSVETGERMLLWCDGGPAMVRVVHFPPPFEIEVQGGMYVLVDEGPVEQWRYEFVSY